MRAAERARSPQPGLRYRWHPDRNRWEFYGYNAPLWRPSVAFTRAVPPLPAYVVSYAETAHELEELDDPARGAWWLSPE